MCYEEVIKLNVGGTHFCTFKETLKQGTFFKDLFEKDNKEKEIYIDRSPELFEEILGFLRSCEILMDDKTDLLELKQEAIFYGFQDMIKSVDHAIDNLLSEQQKSFVMMDMQQFTDLSKIDLDKAFIGSAIDLTTTISDLYEVITVFKFTNRHGSSQSKILLVKKQ